MIPAGPRQGWPAWPGRPARLVALVSLVLGLLVLPASTADAANLKLTPSTPVPISTLTTFSVEGGFSAGLVLDVLFNSVLVGKTGADVDTFVYTGTFKVPPPGAPGQAVCGANQVQIIVERLGTVVDSGTITALCPSITVTPELVSALPGKPRAVTYHITPKDFPVMDPNAYQVSVDGVERAFGGTATDVTVTVTVGCGTHQVTLAENDVTGRLVQATDSVFVMCSSITVTPDTVRHDDQPTRVTVRGRDFHANATLAVRIDDGTPVTAHGDTTGAFTAVLPVSGLPCGTHQVNAVETAALLPANGLAFSADAALTVVDCTEPSLTLDPAVIQEGMLTHVTGTGFTPGAPVTLTWTLPDDTPLPGDCTVDADATGAVDTYCLVLPHGTLGARQLVATQGTRTARADAVVDGGTMQPGTGDDDLIFRR